MSDGHDAVAVVGIGCRFPRGVRHPSAFWRLLCGGGQTVGEVPAARWDSSAYFHPDPDVVGKASSKWGSFLEDVDRFDPEEFQISPREAETMDPQQRLMLEVSYEAFEDAGYPLGDLRGRPVGVFFGLSGVDYSLLSCDPPYFESISPHSATGTALSILANRVSFVFDLQGPSLVVDTACSSSLVAVHLACESLLRGTSSLAIAGGANVILSPMAYIAFSKLRTLASGAECRVFDASADGFVRAEGAGAVVLRRLDAARANGDRIYALIRGSGVNQDGFTGTLPQPNRVAQERLIRETLDKAGVAPEDIQYVEAHGTGTVTGDPIEAEAIGRAVGVHSARRRPCLIGSVKTNIGHLEPAAGVAGLIKAALVLHHGQVPPSLHFREPNPAIDFPRLGLSVADHLTPLDGDQRPWCVGVNSFGFGGTNCHLVLTEATDRRAPLASERPEASERDATGGGTGYVPGALVLPLSAKSVEKLRRRAADHADRLSAADPGDPYDLAYTAALRRDHLPHRLCVHGRDASELILGLQAYARGDSAENLTAAEATSLDPAKLAFVFSGQGSQWAGMGRSLMKDSAVFRDTLVACDDPFRQCAGWSILDVLLKDECSHKLVETDVAQPAICAVQIALAAVWASWGVRPAVVVGHSMGEVAAAHVAGAFDLREAMRLIYGRSRAMVAATPGGRMLAVSLSPDEARRLCGDYGDDQACVAAINGPTDVTLAGREAVLAAIEQRLRATKTFCRFLDVRHAFHSALMDPARDRLFPLLGDIDRHDTSIPFISTVHAGPWLGSHLDATYWWDNVRRPVRFHETVQQILHDGCETVIEVGPHPVLLPSVADAARVEGRALVTVPSVRRQQDELGQMLSGVGRLHCHGYPVRWQGVYPRRGRVVSLPPYPWQGERYWHEGSFARRLLHARVEHPLLGRRTSAPIPTWRQKLDLRELTYLGDHRFRGQAIFPAVAYVEMLFQVASAELGVEKCVVEDLTIHRPLYLEGSSVPELVTEFDPDSRLVRFYSNVSDGGDDAWTLHVTARLRGGQHEAEVPPLDPGQLTAHGEEPGGSILYQTSARTPLAYGPAFQAVRRCWKSGDGTTIISEIVRPDVLAEDHAPYRIHPAMLDACLHGTYLSRPAAFWETAGVTYLPMRAERVRFWRSPRAERVWSRIDVHASTDKYLRMTVSVFDDQGIVLDVTGLECAGVLASGGADSNHMDDWLAETVWVPKPLPGNPPRLDTAWLPTARQLLNAWPGIDDVRRHYHVLSARDGGVLRALDSLPSLYVVRALQQLGINDFVGRTVSLDEIVTALGIDAQHRHQLKRFAILCQAAGFLRDEGPDWTVMRMFECERDPERVWRDVLRACPYMYPQFVAYDRIGRNLGRILAGQSTFLETLFPGGSTHVVEAFYRDAPACAVYNVATARLLATIADAMPEGRTLRVLEVGAGTGGATAHVLPALPGDRSAYTFTDVSPAFFPFAKKQFREHTFVDYRVLDIERDPLSQGFEAASFDVVVASNVLHATRDLRQTVAHARELLAPRGLLVLCEVTDAPEWMNLVFGLAEGWWRFTSGDFRTDSPLLTVERWRRLLAEGFDSPTHVCVDDEDDAGLSALYRGQAVFVAQKPASDETPATVPSWNVETDAPAAAVPPADAGSLADVPRWLILADRGGTGEALATHAAQRGIESHLLDAAAGAETVGAAVRRLAEWPKTAVVYLRALDTAPTTRISVESLRDDESVTSVDAISVIRAVVDVERARRPSLVFVTRGMMPCGPREVLQTLALSQAPLPGIVASARCEYPSLVCRLVDLDPSAGVAENVPQLVQETVGDADGDHEVAIRGGARLVSRLRPLRLLTGPVPNLDGGRPRRGRGASALVVPRSGSLDDLHYAEAPRRVPGRGEVEVSVRVASLNFRDVLKVLGLYPHEGGDTLLLGDECAGVVTSIGPEVAGVHVGDEVMVFGAPVFGGTSFATYLVAPQQYVVSKPRTLTFAEAAALPVAILTAHYCLHDVARVKAGERVLVHAAAGGVGLAALQIALSCGAEVFATCSDVKQPFVELLGAHRVMNSRSVQFADEVLEATNGRGVDVVINSLSGEAIERGVEVLAPGGRFVEIGKRDVYANRSIGLRPLRNNGALHIVDVGHALLHHPEAAAVILRHYAEEIDGGRFHPLPHRVYMASRTREAFRAMSQGSHVGRLVVQMDDPLATSVPSPGPHGIVSSDGTYVISGGTGGFGLRLAQFMLDEGAGQVALLSRRGTDDPVVADRVAALSAGAPGRVAVYPTDVSNATQCAETLQRIARDCPPVRGVIHAALDLQDMPIASLTPAVVRRVMAPKVDGAWNLHTLTRHLPLDFFLLTSSLVAHVGNAGQAAYAGANMFLDHLAHWRWANALPATVVNLGPITDVGFVVDNPHVESLLARRGMGGLSSRQSWEVFREAVRHQRPHVSCALRMDWRAWLDALGLDKLPAKFAALWSESESETRGADTGRSLLSALAAAPVGRHRDLVVEFVQQQVAHVLGTNAETIAVDEPLQSFGLDSLLAVELLNRLERAIGVSIPASVMAERPSVGRLAEHIVRAAGSKH